MDRVEQIAFCAWLTYWAGVPLSVCFMWAGIFAAMSPITHAEQIIFATVAATFLALSGVVLIWPLIVLGVGFYWVLT